MTFKGRSIDLQAVLNNSPLGGFRARVIGLCWLIGVLDGFDVQAMAFVAPVLADLWSIPDAGMGPVLTAGVAGLVVGSVLLGRIGDRIGRRPALLGSVLIFALCSLATALAETTTQLIVLRMLTGIGLGGTVVAALALTVEYAPARARTTLVVAMFIGFPVGGSLGGLIATPVIESFGWQGVFVIGGLLPLALLTLAWRALPESLQFQALEGRSREKLGAIVERIDPTYRYAPGDRFLVHGESKERARISDLFARPWLAGTLLLWLLAFANLMVMYFMISWLPSILHRSGLPLSTANLLAVGFNVGGILGALALGWTIDRLGTIRILAASYGVTALAIWGLASAGILPLVVPLTLLAGGGVLGGYFCLGSVIANFYPTGLRSTGVGWALGIGRVGSVLGPLIGGYAIAVGAGRQLLLSASAVPLLACGVAIVFLARSRHARRSAPGNEEVGEGYAR